MTDAEFAVFVQEVARITEKYETRATPTSVERESPHHPRRRLTVLLEHTPERGRGKQQWPNADLPTAPAETGACMRCMPDRNAPAQGRQRDGQLEAETTAVFL